MTESPWKTMNEPRPQRLAPLLWFLLFLFCLRVIGQVLVAFWGGSWLPPMEEWYSGLLPYPLLLPTQIAIIFLCGRVCLDFTRGPGLFVETRRFCARGLRYFAYLYLLAMVLRYVIRMALLPDERWLGGTIPIFFHWVLASFLIAFALPIFFHWVLASFLIAFAHWHRSRQLERVVPSR